jgi:hypothetical protein
MLSNLVSNSLQVLRPRQCPHRGAGTNARGRTGAAVSGARDSASRSCTSSPTAWAARSACARCVPGQAGLAPGADTHDPGLVRGTIRGLKTVTRTPSGSGTAQVTLGVYLRDLTRGRPVSTWVANLQGRTEVHESSLNSCANHSCQRRQLRSGRLTRPNLRPAGACATDPGDALTGSRCTVRRGASLRDTVRWPSIFPAARVV